LLRLGLLTPGDLVERTITATEHIGRNRLVQVDVAGAPGFVVKQPVTLGTPDAGTMWIEAAVFWLSANEPAFAELAPWMPHYHHYDETSSLLTTERIAPAQSLYALLSADAPIDPATLNELGRAFAALHGSVSACLHSERTRKLFRQGPAWALTLGTPEQSFTPGTAASQAVLDRLREYPGAADALALARETWRDVHLIHGDAKAPNVLVRADGSVRVIDWEIAAVGDGLWDIAGFVHSLLVPKYGEVMELDAAQRRAAPLLDALWAGYVSALPEPPPGADPRVTMLRLAGTRLLQTCLETTIYTDAVGPLLEGTLRMGLELLTRPEQSRARWEQAA
jgi:aminoglycoside phosphotransferase (APT) family kinase protein